MTIPSSAPRHLAVHRPEIDGLRSIAVLSVMLYHFGVPGLGGGFVGVDIFFVISGFLIGGILWREYSESGHLSLSRFYLRRIRRLAPAYFVMTFAALIVGWFVLMPFDYRELGKGAIAATVYLSNVLFFRQAGYFDTSADEKVLLHTWSLSVEEQFYLFLPLFMLALSRVRFAVVPALWMLALLSLVFAVRLTTTHMPAAFFLFPFRAWELLAGVLLAIVGIERDWRWSFGSVPSVLGLALVIGSVVFIRPEAGFPGWQAIFPVLGTVLLIFGGQDDNFVNRALSTKGPVFVGLISYSLYLWHWPVVVMVTYAQGPLTSLAGQMLWIAVSFGLAFVSWKFVEQPVRLSKSLSARHLFSSALAISIATLLAGAYLFKADGIPERFSSEVRVHIDASSDFIQDWSRCHVPDEGAFAGVEVCPIGSEGAPRLLIWGDSHLRAFQDGLAQLADERQQPALIIWHAGCPPFFGISKTESAATAAQDRACSSANEKIHETIASWPDLSTVLFVGRWTYYDSGQGTGLDAHNKITLKPAFADAARETVNLLKEQGRQVFVTQQVPEVGTYDSRRIARELSYGSLSSEQARQAVTVSIDSVKDRQSEVESLWRDLEQKGRIQSINTWPALCDGTTCQAIHDGVGQYFDNNHLTNSAALRLRHLFAPAFDAALQEGTRD